MKTNFQKLKIARKPSANLGSTKQLPTANKQVEAAGEVKPDKISQLRAKIQKDRQAMRQTGKRFNKGNEQSTSTNPAQSKGSISIQKTEENKFFKGEKKSIQVSVGQQQTNPKVQKVQQSRLVTRESINLTELVVQTQKISLNSSKVFQKELIQQKNRNDEVINFLTKLGLANFADGLINMGYDQLEVLLEITSQQLNFLMMRANQQKVLISALKQYRTKQGISEEPKNPISLTQASFFKAKAKNEAPKQKQSQGYKQQIQIRPKSSKTVASTTPTNNSGLFSSSVNPNPSFFIGIGGGDWSLDSLVRRACSSCYKVLPGSDLFEQNGIYSCWSCKQKEEDPLGVSLNNSMIKDYKL